MVHFSEIWCCCLDVITGSVLSGIYTTLVSLIFIGIGVDSLVLSFNSPYHRSDFISTVYGVILALSVLYAIASIALSIGAARKMRCYMIPWLLLTPLWTAAVVTHLIVLPLNSPHSVEFSNQQWRIAGCSIIVFLNIYSVICVSYTLYLFHKTPKDKFKSVGVGESIAIGITNTGTRLRQSFRRKETAPDDSKQTAKVRNDSESRGEFGETSIDMPEMNISAIKLQPSGLEVKRAEVSYRKALKAAAKEQRHEDTFDDVGEDMNSSLTRSQQLSHGHLGNGLDNPAFVEG